MTGKTRKWSKIPSPFDIAAFTGVHCAAKYRKALRISWACPSCARTPHELIRWSYINGVTMRAQFGDAYGMGWTTSIVTHHCHADRRFKATLLCGDCNSADGAAKRKLKLPADWSFSPSEIAQFVTVKPYSGETIIDYETARLIYDEMVQAL